ncbi:spore coat protein [Papillibacter cinnamivorans]|uniref:Coat F domain-containing protein n=1 Tax=Papillibacter cinnamivorans DSM 12816 TaxID=1122930 RepID=A0A1W1ZAX8_9FIRM|nr:spore coat protein [Papillibacter cinnamivorans]SMC45545.1 Coat F domain-containing protein [Papillibacter cinnamivorans DSM 12816]
MPNLTAKELMALEDQLNHEKVLIKKYQTVANECTDSALKTSFQDISNRHQQHFNNLIKFLQ